MKPKLALALLALIVCLGFLSCRTSPEVNTSIEGIWDRRDIVISISGSTGVFTQINPNTQWRRVLERGSIGIGAQNMRNITRTGPLSWTAQVLRFNEGTYEITGWSDAQITMAEDGLSIHILVSGVANPEHTYRRVVN
ncbi:MAG: hypothetical protein FWH12_07190 [Treponema sp.]|nr:hypothetical protein [Treponema sp.]